MTTIASLLQPVYYTAMVGKWDCGMATPQHTPHGRGFESSLCYFHHENDYFTRYVAVLPRRGAEHPQPHRFVWVLQG